MKTEPAEADNEIRDHAVPCVPLSRVQTVVVCLALLLEGMSSSSINVQIVAVRDAFEIGPAVLGVVIAAFLVAYAGLLPTAGRLVDVRDRRTVFLTGVALFGIGSLLCALSANVTMIIVGRLVQGVGAALSAPAALALITHGLPEGKERNRAVATYGAMGAAGFSLGLVLPAFVVSALGWRASFALLLPIVVIVLAVSWRVVGGSPRERQPLDLVGAAALTGLLMVAVHLIGSVGSGLGWVTLVEGALVVLLAVVLVRRGGTAGGFPAQVALTPRVLAACLALAAVFAGAIPSYYVVSLALQTAHGAGAFEVGLALVPNPIAFALLATHGSRLVTRFGPGRVLTAGMGLITLALVVLAVIGLSAAPLLTMLPVQVAIGGGLALAFPAASILAINAVPEAFRGTTAGLLTTWQNVGGAIGLALVTAFGVVPTAADADVAPGLLLCAGLLAVGGAVAAVIGRRRTVARGEH